MIITNICPLEYLTSSIVYRRSHIFGRIDWHITSQAALPHGHTIYAGSHRGRRGDPGSHKTPGSPTKVATQAS